MLGGVAWCFVCCLFCVRVFRSSMLNLCLCVLGIHRVMLSVMRCVLVCDMFDVFVCLCVVLSDLFVYARDCGVCVLRICL